MTINRRLILAAPVALAACGSAEPPPPPPTIAPLKSTAPFPVGLSAMTGQFDDPQWVDLVRTHFNQLTPEWEMKMERIMTADGGYDFSAADRIAAFARDNGLRLYGTTLIWYAQDHPHFHDLDQARFEADYDRWIATVAGRYRGQAVGWDVVNEPVKDDGEGLRDCLWSQRLGQDGYMIRAFEQARLADPDAVLFINDYNLENNPKKGATFLRTVERLLKAGAPIGGLGTQSHLDIEIPAGQITAFMRELAAFGLPIHVSELDASLRNGRSLDTRSRDQKLEQQKARVVELAEAFMALPPAQRFAFTVWGLRDTDSWLRRAGEDDGRDQPLLFDTLGRPKPLAAALEAAFRS